jgi:hypothetical protein
VRTSLARALLARGLIVLGLAAAGCRAPGAWQPLLEGQWTSTPFGGGGEVHGDGESLTLEPGDPLTGVTWQAPLPEGDYELSLIAARLQGTDFFVGLTFPVDDAHLTLVLGGWGGALCGLSCLDGDDASSNESKFFEGFEDGRDYEVRLEVRGRRVRAWIDGRRVVDVDTTGRVIGLRTEVEACAPLGLASFLTQARYRELRWRPLR